MTDADGNIRQERKGKRSKKQKKMVFVCYSRADEEFVRGLVADLRVCGADVWFDNEIEPGVVWPGSIQEALDSATVMILVLSPNSIRSDNVADEWVYFKGHLKKPIIPVMWKKTKVPYQLYRLEYVDFINMGPGSTSYPESFERLAMALRRHGLTCEKHLPTSAVVSDVLSTPRIILPRLQMERSIPNYIGLGLDVIRRYQYAISACMVVLIIFGLLWGYFTWFSPDGNLTPTNSAPITATFEAKRAATMNALRTEAAARDATRTANARFGTPTFTGTPTPTVTETPDGTATWNALLTEAAATHAAETATATTPTPVTGP